MTRITSIAEWILRLPFVWGGVLGIAFYAALAQRWIDSPLLRQYMAGHRVEYVIGFMFFIGLAALVMRFITVAGQFATLDRIGISPIPAGGQATWAGDALLAELADLPRSLHDHYLVRRLREALELVRRKDTAENIEQNLHHLADQDVVRMSSEYALVRIIVWAIPILGLLGTVIGITLAISNLKPETLEQSLSEVTAGLGVAFDHTGEALTLTMVLMFVKYLVERSETRLLTIVDERVAEELIGRFKYDNQETDPNVTIIRRMSEQVIGAIESSVTRQAQAWQASIDETHQQWADVSTSTGRIINESLSAALRDNLAELGRQLNDGTQAYAERLSESSETSVARMRQGLEKLAELLVEALHKHGEVMTVNERDIADENRRHLSEVEAALGEAMVVASDRQENLIRRSEDLLKEMQIALISAAEATIRHQEQLVKQSDVLLRVVDSTGQVKALEEALNENLASLARSHRFDEMAMNLTAAIQMLCARAGTVVGTPAPVSTPSTPSALEMLRAKSASHAA